MKRYEYERAVYESDLDSSAKSILLYYGFRKNWATDGKVWISAATAARDTGLSVSTVNRRMPRLRRSGWLLPTVRVVGNGAREYELAVGQALEDETDTGTDAQGPSTPTTQTHTTVTSKVTTSAETDKEVTNNKNNQMKEKVMTDAGASVDDFSLVRRNGGNTATSLNSKSTGLSSRDVRNRVYAQTEADKQIGRDILEEEITKTGMGPEDAQAARKRYESSTFMPKAGPGPRAIQAIYWRPEDDAVQVSTGTWDDEW